MIIAAYLAAGLLLLVGHMTCCVCGGRGAEADAISDAEYRKKAEARLSTLSVATEGEVRVYRHAVAWEMWQQAAAASKRSLVEREAEDVAQEAWG